ncbi:FMN-dependent NADH-azoreductase [Alloalcanivorax sp. C16-2]|uniref:FMN-dependent NADH-azoreductase n=1 Tax=Alloalcanivorax sp. C16-2 TaxID=3390052 RepID=UPI003970E1F3
MARLLHIAASPSGRDSHSRAAAERAIQYWRRRWPGLSTIGRDLAASPPPHPDAEFVAASLCPAPMRTPAQQARLRLSETLIGELSSAAAILISTPMHNFSLPSPLKAWVDHVVRPGRTFQTTPDGKRGLLTDRPVRVIMACGGVVGPPGQRDWVTPYLSDLFAVIGLRDFQAFTLERCRPGDVGPGLSPRQLEAGFQSPPLHPAG